MTDMNSPASTNLLSEAADWVNEQLSGDMTPADYSRLQEWVSRSPYHKQAYETVSRGWMIASTINSQHLLPDIAAPKPSDFGRRPRFAVAASLLLTLTLGFAGWYELQRPPSATTFENFQTSPRQRSVITLPDNTKVTMDAETRLSYNYSDGKRNVELTQGRAYFDVANDPTRPFSVHIDGKTVLALGTVFEVGINGDEISIVLAEGKVRVEDSKRRGSAELEPGRQLVIRSDRQWTLRNVDVEKETSWKDGRLIFMSEPLQQAIGEVNRYSHKKIEFENGVVPSISIVGIFSAGDIEGFIHALELNGIARKVKSDTDRVVMAAD